MKLGGQAMGFASKGLNKLSDSTGLTGKMKGDDEMRRKKALAGQMAGGKFNPANHVGRFISNSQKARDSRRALLDQAETGNYSSALTKRGGIGGVGGWMLRRSAAGSAANQGQVIAAAQVAEAELQDKQIKAEQERLSNVWVEDANGARKMNTEEYGLITMGDTARMQAYDRAHGGRLSAALKDNGFSFDQINDTAGGRAIRRAAGQDFARMADANEMSDFISAGGLSNIAHAGERKSLTDAIADGGAAQNLRPIGGSWMRGPGAAGNIHGYADLNERLTSQAQTIDAEQLSKMDDKAVAQMLSGAMAYRLDGDATVGQAAIDHLNRLRDEIMDPATRFGALRPDVQAVFQRAENAAPATAPSSYELRNARNADGTIRRSMFRL